MEEEEGKICNKKNGPDHEQWIKERMMTSVL
jgi:hypothetical protein